MRFDIYNYNIYIKLLSNILFNNLNLFFYEIIKIFIIFMNKFLEKN